MIRSVPPPDYLLRADAGLVRTMKSAGERRWGRLKRANPVVPSAPKFHAATAFATSPELLSYASSALLLFGALPNEFRRAASRCCRDFVLQLIPRDGERSLLLDAFPIGEHGVLDFEDD